MKEFSRLHLINLRICNTLIHIQDIPCDVEDGVKGNEKYLPSIKSLSATSKFKSQSPESPLDIY